MPSLIIYASGNDYLDKTIDCLLDRTPPGLIDEIIVCDDSDSGFKRDGVITLSTNRIGYAKSCSAAAKIAIGNRLVFMKSRTKVGERWLEPLLETLQNDDRCLVSSIVHTLNLDLWATEPSRWRRFGWRWDLNLYDRICTTSASPAISMACIVCTKQWFDYIGGFDVGMKIGAGADIDISLKSWLCGGSVRVNDVSSIATAITIESGSDTIYNLTRIVETWLSAYVSRFYDIYGPSIVDCGRIVSPINQQHSIDWFIRKHQPELFGLYDFYGLFKTKTVAVIGDGPSLDYIDTNIINRYDVLIGCGYSGLFIDCDYVIATDVEMVGELRRRYRDDQLLVPHVLHNYSTGTKVPANAVVAGAKQFEEVERIAVSGRLPFSACGHAALSGVQVAIFGLAASIVVFGCDFKLVGGRGRSIKFDKYYAETEWTGADDDRLRIFDHRFQECAVVAQNLKIPLLRFNCV